MKIIICKISVPPPLLLLCLLCVSCKSTHIFTCDEIKGNYEGYYTDNESSSWSTKLAIYLEQCRETSFGYELHGRQTNLRTSSNTELEGTSGAVDMQYGKGSSIVKMRCITNNGNYGAKGNIELVQGDKDTGTVYIYVKVEDPGYFKPGKIILKKVSN